MNNYKAVRPNLNTFDLVLFSGDGAGSTAIKLFTGSMWSHVGMVYYDPVLDVYFVWESTRISNFIDAETGVEKRGVQLNPMSERIKQYQGTVAVRHLNNIDRNSGMIADLANFRSEVKGRPYEKSLLELARSKFDGSFSQENIENLYSIFCSELVAEAYQRVGFLQDKYIQEYARDPKPSNEYIPRDFSTQCKHPLMLLNGDLTNEIYVKT